MAWRVKANKRIFYGDVLLHPKTKKVLGNTQQIFDPATEGPGSECPKVFVIRSENKAHLDKFLKDGAVTLLGEVADEEVQPVVIPITAAAPISEPIKNMAAALNPDAVESMERALSKEKDEPEKKAGRPGKKRASDIPVV